MDKDKLISFITANRYLSDYPEITEWINASAENREEYIRYKNLWAMLQQGNEMTETRIKEGLFKVRKNARHTKQLIVWKYMRYAAFIVMALLGGYIAGTSGLYNKTAMNEIFVPKGSRSSVVLPDGSKVWLNNGTKLIYPESFRGKNRNVELDGEAFFEVSHDKEHPFVVNMGENRIKVLGTRFAVVAYSQDNIIKAELVSGKIQFDIRKKNGKSQFRSYMMESLQSLVFNKNSGSISESKIPDNFYNYWLNGVYEFKNETFAELAKKMERIYNVQVIFRNESLKGRLFTGSLSINDNIYTMMEIFKRASKEPFSYTHEGNRIFIGEEKN